MKKYEYSKETKTCTVFHMYADIPEKAHAMHQFYPKLESRKGTLAIGLNDIIERQNHC
jgi:hypothetical protein